MENLIERENSIVQVTEDLLDETKTRIENKSTLTMPIAEISTLGVVVSSGLSFIKTIKFSKAGDFYQIANKKTGDVLKVAKDGLKWGSMKTASRKSKMVKLSKVNPTSAIAGINPSLIMIAVALYSIEKEIKNISHTGKQILSFLEIEKESEIKGNLYTLMDIVKNYKFNWENEHYVSGNHKQVLDIKRKSRQNIIGYQENIYKIISNEKKYNTKNKINSTYNDLKKNSEYYRLSIYSFSFASMLEIMLSENFNEEYIKNIQNELEEASSSYRDLFCKGSSFLEKSNDSSIESVLNNSFKSVLNLIPNNKKDENYEKLDINEMVKEFAGLSNPETRIFINKMDEITRIYNHTDDIYFDNDKIYLVGN